VRVAVLGGTASFGRALAIRLVAAGEHDVVIGSRDAARAAEAASELGGTAGTANDEAVQADLVVLAVKADGAPRPHDTSPLRLERRPPLGRQCDPVSSRYRCASRSRRAQPCGANPDVDAPVIAGLHSTPQRRWACARRGRTRSR
jgi:hypothetical protein